MFPPLATCRSLRNTATPIPGVLPSPPGWRAATAIRSPVLAGFSSESLLTLSSKSRAARDTALWDSVRLGQDTDTDRAHCPHSKAVTTIPSRPRAQTWRKNALSGPTIPSDRTYLRLAQSAHQSRGVAQVGRGNNPLYIL